MLGIQHLGKINYACDIFFGKHSFFEKNVLFLLFCLARLLATIFFRPEEQPILIRLSGSLSVKFQSFEVYWHLCFRCKDKPIQNKIKQNIEIPKLQEFDFRSLQVSREKFALYLAYFQFGCFNVSVFFI